MFGVSRRFVFRLAARSVSVSRLWFLCASRYVVRWIWDFGFACGVVFVGGLIRGSVLCLHVVLGCLGLRFGRWVFWSCCCCFDFVFPPLRKVEMSPEIQSQHLPPSPQPSFPQPVPPNGSPLASTPPLSPSTSHPLPQDPSKKQISSRDPDSKSYKPERVLQAPAMADSRYKF